MADQDTIQAQADDTVVADAGEDTVQADAGQDTVAADAAADKAPFADFDEPKVDEVQPAQAAAAPVITPDEYETELTAIEAEADTDPTSAMKKLTALNRRKHASDKIERGALQRQVSQASADAAYRAFERESGLTSAPQEVRTKLTEEVVIDRYNKHLKAAMKTCGDAAEARGEARATLRMEIKQIIAAAEKGKPNPIKRVKTTDTGARLVPPGSGGRVPKEPARSDTVFVKGNWSYPTPVPLND